jgi:hypothetical protein
LTRSFKEAGRNVNVSAKKIPASSPARGSRHMDNIVRALQGTRNRICIEEIRWDDLDREALQPADTVSAWTNEAADTKTKAEELFSGVTADKSGASCNDDRRNRENPSLTLPTYSSILKKIWTSKDSLIVAHEVVLTMGGSSRWIYLRNADNSPALMKSRRWVCTRIFMQ